MKLYKRLGFIQKKMWILEFPFRNALSPQRTLSSHRRGSDDERARLFDMSFDLVWIRGSRWCLFGVFQDSDQNFRQLLRAEILDITSLSGGDEVAAGIDDGAIEVAERHWAILTNFMRAPRLRVWSNPVPFLDLIILDSGSKCPPLFFYSLSKRKRSANPIARAHPVSWQEQIRRYSSQRAKLSQIESNR